ncbi:MAG: hypothetical protein F6K58_21875 [Symploca sp. SIO2E9]|nr:hypothetical protein [Symploca sp. SIO2E9]
MYYHYNQGYEDLARENDPAGLRFPYYIIGKQDREMLVARYAGLQKISYGVISRTGKDFKQWFDYG